MSGSRTLCVVALVAAGSVACSDTSITAPPAEDDGLLVSVHGHATLDVDGDWVWTALEKLSFPAWAAAGVFGIVPEGPITHAECLKTGTLTLDQTGATFTGAYLATGGECVTSGGQVFAGVAPGVPGQVMDGAIRGHSLAWQQLGAGGAVLCSMHAVASETVGSTVTELSGGGPCVVPGHPMSSVPADPPPGGTETIVSWTAVRP